MDIKAIIVDDEKFPRQLLRGKLEEHFPSIQIVGEASNASEAREYIEQAKPDLLFLDISMPKENGFDLLRSLPDVDFELIFVTSFDQYALEAIEFCAIGYVLKPIDTDAFVLAVNNAINRITQKSGHQANRALINNLSEKNTNKQMALSTSDGLEFIPVKNIVRCEGYQKYTYVYLTGGKKILSSNNIGKFIHKLEPYGFYTTHKSHLVNTTFIKRYLKSGLAILEDGTEVPVSRRKKSDFLEYLKKDA